MKTIFNDLPVLAVFTFSGTKWVKQSSRTAHIYGKPNIWFYFSKSELVNRYKR